MRDERFFDDCGMVDYERFRAAVKETGDALAEAANSAAESMRQFGAAYRAAFGFGPREESTE
jgi:hypothetical protein